MMMCHKILVTWQDNGQYLVAVDESNEHVLSVWDWQKTDKGHRVTEIKVSLFCCHGVEF